MKNIDTAEITKLKEGDATAMEYIYNALYGEVFAYSLSYVADTEQAFEITQDTFVYLWEKRASLRSDSNIKSYPRGPQQLSQLFQQTQSGAQVSGLYAVEGNGSKL